MSYYHSRYSSRKKKRNPFKRFLLWLLLLVIIVAGIAGWFLYGIVFKPNVWTADGNAVSIYIPTGADYNKVKESLYEKGLIVHRNNFEWWAEQKKYPSLIKPGHFLVKDNLTNNELVNLLRSGNQVPVKVIFNNVLDIYELAGVVSHQIEADSASLLDAMLSPSHLSKYGLDTLTSSTMYIPNTYEFYWNTNAKGFVKRMGEEYNKFWNDSRKVKAVATDLTIPEVVILASIVEKETNKNDEKPMIACVYINRLNAGWLLQADPTLVFALNDPSIHRVLNKHMQVESPYNTYINRGLPPGPICIPSIASIDAVLNHSDENYLFFCARDDLSGYHAFARTHAQHNKNAKAYREALDKLNIYK